MTTPNLNAPVYLLEKDGELLARLPLVEQQGDIYQCAFEPTPAFSPYAELFAEDAAVAEALTHQDEVEFMERPTELTDAIEDLNLTVRRENGSEARRVLLGIDSASNTATFRMLDPDEVI